MSYLVDANKNLVNVAGSNATYTLTATDEIYLAFDNQIVLVPDPSTLNKGRTYTIKLNGAYTNGVTIKSLDEQNTYYTINKNYGSVNLVSDGTQWIVLADIIQVSEIATTTYVNDSTWTHQGTWSALTSYVAKDVVVNNGSTWLALQPSLNSTPAENANWTLIASKGDTGATGNDGSPGLDGADGADGSNGLSAFEVAVANGFVGDEPTWLASLVGANGNDGAPGLDGNDGAPGANGADAVWYFQGAWNGATLYVIGDIVTYNGETWYSLQPNNNSAPTDINTDWTKLASKGGQILADNNTWTGTNNFQEDVVIEGASAMLSIRDTVGGGGNLIFEVSGATGNTTLYGNTTIVGGTLTFAIQDATTTPVFTVDSNTGNTQIQGDLTVTGSLIVNGQTTTINTVNLNVTDSLIQLSDGLGNANPVNDAGFIIARGTENNASLFWNEDTAKFVFATATSLASDFTGNILVSGGTITYSTVRLGALEANTIGGIESPLTITGSLTGNADTATAWATAMTLSLGGTIATGSVSFDGSTSPTTLNLSLNDNSITNAKLENDSINIGGSNIALGGTLALSNDFSFTGGTLGLTGTLSVYSTGAIALAKTINLAGAVTGSLDLNNQFSAMTLTTTLGGTITNADLEYSSINIGGVTFALGSTLGIAGDSYITANVTGTTLDISLGTIDNAILQYDSVRIGSYDLVLGGTLALSNLAITGSTLGLSTTINLTDNQASALDIIEGANSYLKFITTEGSEKVVVGKNLQLEGNLTVNGTTTTVNSTTVTIDDPIFTLGGDTPPLTDDNKDRGIEFKWHNGTSAIIPDNMVNGQIYYIVSIGNTDFTQIGASSNTVGLSFTFNGSASQNGTTGTGIISTALKTGFFGYDDSASAFTFIPNATNSSEVFSGSAGNAIFGGLTATSLDLTEGNITNVGDVALDSISADNNAIAINLTDNQASALDITQSTNSYLKFVTTDGNEKVLISKTLDLNEGNITNVGSIALDSISADNNAIAINLTDNQASALDITEGANSYLKFVTTNNSESLTVGKTLKVIQDMFVYDGPDIAQTAYLYVKYNATSQTDNEYFYIFRTTDGGATREVVPLSNLSNLEEDTSLGWKRYRANQASSYTNTTPTGTVNASLILEKAYTYYFIIRTDNDNTSPNIDFQAYLSTSNSASNITYNDVLPYGGGFSDDGEANKYTIVLDNSSWSYATLDAPSTVTNRSSEPVLASTVFSIDNTNGDTTLGTDASLSIKKATSASSPLIVLNSDTTSTGHQDAVISVERGDGNDAKLTWDNSNTLWTADNATGNARPLSLHSPVDTNITTSTPVTLTGNAKGEYEKVYLVANNNTAITINLFSLASSYNGYKVIIKKIDNGAGTITISPNVLDTIDGAGSSISISTGYGSVTLIADASTGWWII